MSKEADTPYGDVTVPINVDTLTTQIAALQTAVTNLQAGIGITLPTSAGTTGHLYSNAGVVTVSP